MTTIRKVFILGAGAMGVAYADMFTQCKGFEVAFVARGERYTKLKGATLTVNGRPQTVSVVRPDEVTGPADLILVALKHHHLVEALADIKALAGEATIILSVMNGLESEEVIGRACGMDKMVLAIAVGIDATRENNVYTYGNRGWIIFGASPSTGDQRRVRHLQEALNRAGIPNEVPADIMRSLWWKFMINVGINQASAVLRAPYGVFQSSQDAMQLMKMLMEEVILLAQKAQIDLRESDLDEWCDIMAGLSPGGKTSMLQDVEAGRKTEVEIFAGKVVALGEQYDVPTPVNGTVLRIIKVLESGLRPSNG